MQFFAVLQSLLVKTTKDEDYPASRGSLLPCLIGCWGKNIFLVPSLHLSCLHFCCCLPPVHHCEESSFAILMSFSQVLGAPVRSCKVCFCQAEQALLPQPPLREGPLASAEHALVCCCTQLDSLTQRIPRLTSYTCQVIFLAKGLLRYSVFSWECISAGVGLESKFLFKANWLKFF